MTETESQRLVMDLRTPGRPTLPDDLSGFSTVEELIDKLIPNRSVAFPFERELALYLLLIASLWPNDHERLLAAARIFSGALNFHLSRVRADSTARSEEYAVFFRELSERNVKSFNESFFSKIGGPLSLLICPSVNEFYRTLLQQVEDLAMVHDVIEYLVKSSPFKRIGSATFAYHAIAHNIFARPGGYGIASGPKRTRGETDVSSAETVRAKCRKVQGPAILSFIMTRWHRFYLLDPTCPEFFCELIDYGPGSLLLGSLSAMRERVLKNKSKVNISMTKWARLTTPPLKKAWLYVLSRDELEQALAISAKVFKRPLTQEEQDSAREILESPRSAMGVRFPPRQ